MNLSTRALALSFVVFFCGTLASVASAAERPHLVKVEDLPKWWVVADADDAQVPPNGKNLTAPTCAAVSFRINRGGTISDVKLEKIVPEGDLSQVAVSSIRALHYVAAAQNVGKDPVYTYQILLFNAPDVKANPGLFAEKQRIYNQCKLEDFKLPASLM